MVFTIPELGSGVALIVHDRASNVGGVAHILLPDNQLAGMNEQDPDMPAKFANIAVPLLFEQFEAMGGNKKTSTTRLVGGAQLFNFGGGGGNPLNTGPRNAIAIRAAVSRLGYVISKTDIGGNKARNLRFVLITGQVHVQPVGGNASVL